ncbi:hypothetical protein FEM48_Zijuj03G0108100 [Ziziphus jujuba var. spinosa]|uniref:Uncharacterized protein n=1 Tax=Ziziphus jujuba var. spinosa TaxID=714518 RepID=A0A978VPV6_ZIZJJ|nr:hypothetical protein FEM48_Zijuj03G0108100 [Ziziphus jujuba var. spinosa]
MKLVFLHYKLRAEYQNLSKSSAGASIPKVSQVRPFFGATGTRKLAKEKGWSFCLSVADSDRLTTETSDKSSGNAEIPLSAENSRVQISAPHESGPQTTEASNGSVVSSDQEGKISSPNNESKPKKSPLTAREKLRAARVLSRYTESKPSKSDMGSKVLDALRESDRGKKKGLPEAPGNMLDDSKRGLPKQGFTFEFPGGADLFFIVFSFVFISTVMFATTYLVWKVGAIHFNEY